MRPRVVVGRALSAAAAGAAATVAGLGVRAFRIRDGLLHWMSFCVPTNAADAMSFGSARLHRREARASRRRSNTSLAALDAPSLGDDLDAASQPCARTAVRRATIA